MLNKGYDRPLYSLNLIQGPGQVEEDARYFIPDPLGRLVVSPSLRRHGTLITTDDCLRALHRGVSYHALGVDPFTAAGLDAEWAENLVYWGDRLDRLDVEWRGLGHILEINVDERAGLRLAAQDLWSRLRFAGALTGLGDLLAKGRLPTSGLGRIAALRRTHARVTEPGVAGLLDHCGFPGHARAALWQIARDLESSIEEDVDLERRRHEALAAMVVMRGAIVGDLRLLSQAARRIYRKGSPARALRMGRLLGDPRPHRARPQPSPA